MTITLRSRRRLLAVVSTLVLGLAAASAGAAPSMQPASVPVDAHAWIARMHAAANERNYQGTMVFSADGIVSSTRVAHFCEPGSGQSFERVEALDGRMHRIYRHNEVVLKLWPQTRVAVMEQRDWLQPLPSMSQSVEPRAQQHYEFRFLGNDRVAGREARIFLLKPRDELRYAQRIWADAETGLMLRADVLGGADQVLESSAFSEVEIGVKPQPDSVVQPMKRLQGYRIVRPRVQQTTLDAEGWSMQPNLPGFTLTNCMKRSLDAADGRGEDQSPQVLQAVYSDGLTHVSVFVEPFDGERHRHALETRIGATSTLMQRLGEAWWLTVIGDVPPRTLRHVATGIARRRP